MPRKVSSMEKISTRRQRDFESASSCDGDRFHSFMLHAPFAIQIHSPDGLLLEVNSTWEKVWGISAEKLIGSFNILENEYARSQGICEIFQRARAGKSTKIRDHKYDPADFGHPGRRHWARSRVFPLSVDSSDVTEIVILHEDITVFKESEERFNIVVENANEAIIVVQDGRMKFFNKKALEIAGYTDESDYAGKPFQIFVHPDYREELMDRHIRRMRGESVPSFYQAQILHKDGYGVWLQLNVIRTDWEGRPASLAFLFDITAQKKVEHALARSEALFKTLFHHAGDIIFIHDQNGKILEVNQVACEILGASHADLTGMNVSDIGFHCFNQPVSGEELSSFSGQKVYETVYARKDGVVVPVEINATSIEFGGLPATINVCRNIAERKKIQDYLQQAKEDWEETFDSIDQAITVHDMNNNVIRANMAATELLGIAGPELLKKKCSHLFHGGEDSSGRCPTCRVAKDGVPVSMERFDSSLGRHVSMKGFPRYDKEGKLIGVIHMATDITARKRMEEEQKQLQNQLLHSQKMESIGRLAGGVAHDFNNILTVILNFTKFVMDELPEGPLHEDLIEIRDAGARAASLTRQLLAFSRRQVMEMEPTDLWTVVDGMRKMLERMLGADIELICRHSGNIGHVMADAGQMEQVLMNLVVNARDAMPGGGRLLVEVLPASADGAVVDDNQEGTHVLLRVSDTGCGIPKDIRNSVFEPFFTTKDVGKGTGLGLATVYGIVSQHHGRISIHDLPEEGTRFDIVFPACEETDDEQTGDDAIELCHGSETILVVEDDPAILRAIQRILGQLGYTVLAAGGGDEAMAISLAHEGEIPVLLTDVIMPGINGKTLAGLIRADRPAIKTIFMSGYTDDVFEQHGILGTGAPLIQKPLDGKRLGSVVRAMLDVGRHRQIF